jgi:hypothetical protein
VNELMERIGQVDDTAAELLSAAPRGSEQVEATLYRLVEKPLTEADAESQP